MVFGAEVKDKASAHRLSVVVLDVVESLSVSVSEEVVGVLVGELDAALLEPDDEAAASSPL